MVSLCIRLWRRRALRWGVKQNLDDVLKALGAIQFAINGYKIDFKSEESISTDITIYGLGWE